LKALIEDERVQFKGLMAWERGTIEEKLEIDWRVIRGIGELVLGTIGD